MAEKIVAKYSSEMKNATVLELGCGPGLVGILCGLMGASKVLALPNNLFNLSS